MEDEQREAEPEAVFDPLVRSVTPSLSSAPFVEFKPTLDLAKLGPAHPTRVVESSSLAAIELPKVNYQLSRRLLSGSLSDVQLEAVLLACNAHENVFRGRRCGMLIGDGAGMGKGRTIGGIILQNYIRGRKKSIWLSSSNILVADARRDLNSLGFDSARHLKSFAKAFNKKTNKLLIGSYCLFATYGILSGKDRDLRLKAIKNWLTGKFDGVIALDECHTVKNKSSKSHTCLSIVNKMFPKARFVYCSATVAESPADYRYMYRLGLYGPGTSYPNGFSELERVLAKTGYIGLETLAMELKHKGCYISRRLDQGCAEFSVQEVQLSPASIKLYNLCTELWAQILKACTQERFKMRYYWAAHQRFFRLLSLSLKLKSVISYVRRELAAGNSIVLALQSTGYAKMSNLKRTKYKKLPSCLYLMIKDVTSYLLDDLELIQFLLHKARSYNLPPNFLDALVDELGASNLAELTGRKERIIRNGNAFVWQKVSDSRLRAQKKFMAGKVRIAIISDAASCGISLHASLECKNQRRRVHITLELPWSAEKVIQQCGRTLRSNQACAPKYVLLVTDVAGEKRFGYGIASRMQTLGAITQADRTLSVNSVDNFYLHSKESEAAIKYTLQTIALEIKPILRYPGRNIFDFFKNAFKPLSTLRLLEERDGSPCLPKRKTSTEQFLNRLLGAKLPMQNEIYNYMLDIYSILVSQSKQMGTFDEGVIDIGKRASFVVKTEQFSLKETRITLFKLKADQGVSFFEALEMKKSSNFAKFYADGSRYVYMVIRFLNTGKYFRVYPSGISAEEFTSFEKYGYKEVTTDTASLVWDRMFKLGDRCYHGRFKCKSRSDRNNCAALNRFQLRSMLVGILWSNLSAISNIFEDAGINSLQLMRCKLQSKNLVGLYIPEDFYTTVRDLLLDNIM